MTLEEATADLGWGLHDALLQSITVDWAVAELRLRVRLRMDERQTKDQLAEITITGLEYCVVDPPGHADAATRADGRGLWIDDGPGTPPNQEGALLPTPEGCFAHWIFCRDTNGFIRLCGRNAAFRWIEAGPVSVAPSP